MYRQLLGLLTLACCACDAHAQNSRNAILEPVRTHAAAVLDQLRGERIDRAFTAFGAAADLTPTIQLERDSGLPAAAAGLYRALAQLDSDLRFDLLYAWSMPTESRNTVRLLTTIVPQVAPPQAFARALGERPRDESFPISSVGQIRGLFSTGWLLVCAADDRGRLRRLVSELDQLAADEVPNADVLLLLARLKASRFHDSRLAELLAKRVVPRRASHSESREQAAAGEEAVDIDPSSLVLAAAASTRTSLRPVSEELFSSLLASTSAGTATRLRPFLRLAHATVVQLHRGESGPQVLRKNRLKYWVPVSGTTSQLSARGATDAVWLVHDDHVLHLAGAHNDLLFFRYPLTGDFEFRCEAQQGCLTDGGLVYGGLQFQPGENRLNVGDADMAHFVRQPCPFLSDENRPVFNRISIRSTGDQIILSANRQPVWIGVASAAAESPWLALMSLGPARPLFRHLAIRGRPVIPREVPLSAGNSLRGWRAGFYGETQPSLFDLTSDPAEEVDWYEADRVIHGRRRDASLTTNPQSRLHYQRPLLDGEAISYEFHYQSGEYEVHPSLGRLAFLIEPRGVRIHWMTDQSSDWTGLPADNALREPLNRRGPRRLPLKNNDWNSVRLVRGSRGLTISLNEVVIYQRPIDFGGDHTFGFYRNRTSSAAKIRHVVMTGNWPESVPEDFSANPLAVEP